MIQRYYKDSEGEYEHPEGRYVLYDDHVAAVAEARQEGRESIAVMWDADKETFPGRIIEAHDAGYAACKQDAREAVEAAKNDLIHACSYGDATLADRDLNGYDRSLAAIDALRGES